MKWMLLLAGLVSACGYQDEADRIRLNDKGLDLEKDCADCPELVLIEPGKLEVELYPYDWSGLKKYHINIDYPYYVGRTEVTQKEYEFCIQDGGCESIALEMKSDSLPVYRTSFQDAHNYVSWLSRKTGKAYRLLSEAEWVFMSQAGSEYRYWWGDIFNTNLANCKQCGKSEDSSAVITSVKSYPANLFGVYDTVGNVSEWVSDCADWRFRKELVASRPLDGSAYMESESCKWVMNKGGGQLSDPRNTYVFGTGVQKNSAFPEASVLTGRANQVGIRVVRM